MASARQIHVGCVPIGGGAPVAVQSMTRTETADYEATMRQIRAIADAGADLVRVAAPHDKDVEALRSIVVESPLPVVADIHFNHALSLRASTPARTASGSTQVDQRAEHDRVEPAAGRADRLPPTSAPTDYEQAAALYRARRRGGETSNALTDCVVAAVAIRAASSATRRFGLRGAGAPHRAATP